MRARVVRCAVGSFVLIVSVGAIAAGCLVRPVVAGEPDTTTNFTTEVQAQAVDKLDILFGIDNSASMGDKQAFLEQAIPDLINRLVNPNCLDASNNVKAPSVDGTCPSGQTSEFAPVHDMHIGLVSSSLGPRLGDQYGKKDGGICGATLPYNDDKGYLVTRTGTSDAASSTAPGGFLDWFPTATNSGKTPPAGALGASGTLVSDFTDLIAGLHQSGCGVESQLESWYRFLIQPDPYASLALDSNGRAQWVGVDTTILQQRRDFLRPDSLVAIIVLTDENDSEIDVRSYGGQGYDFMSRSFQPPHGTTACATNPADPKCQSCPKGSTDPACVGPAGNPANVYAASNDWGYDINLRHVHMKAKYGLDPQFPIGRYVTGLSSLKVPDRTGEYPAGANGYVGTTNCSNPLFAASLPDPANLSTLIAKTLSPADEAALCNLTPGTRPTTNVFYGIIGGVPYQLLNYDGATGVSTLGDADWVKILGKDPENFDYTGIDPHMVESSQPRNGGAFDVGGVLAAPSASDGTDPVNGREWITDQGVHNDFDVDREYACTFRLPTRRDCSDPANAQACDCPTGKESPPLTHEQTPSVCDPTNVTSQVNAKSYPTIRELDLARKLGKQGVASSICPAHVSDQSADGKTDPLYGYRPAVASIINRLKTALTAACLPQQLKEDGLGAVPCLVLATLPTRGDESACTGPGLSTPDPTLLAQFRMAQHAEFLANGGADAGGPDPSTEPVCQVAQVLPADFVNGSCKQTTNKVGWCYVAGSAAGACSQSISFTTQAIPTGTRVSLQCIEPSLVGDGG